MQQFQLEVDQACKAINMRSRSQREPIVVNAEICWDLEDSQFTWAWTKHKTHKGIEKDFVKAIEGFEICKKSEATILCTIGDKTDAGCWIIGKHKNYWLKPIAQI